MALEVDILETQKSLIDLAGHSDGNFGFGEDYKLSFVFEDIILVEYVDEAQGAGDVINRGGIFVPTNSMVKAWRKAKVILVGPSAQYAKVGDIVIFPNDKGVSVANIEIDGYGILKKGMFLNERRLFGICKRKE